MAKQNIKNYTLGRGKVYFATFKPGTQTPDGYRYIGNTPAFGFTTTSTELDHLSSDEGVGELDLSIQTNVTRSGTLTTDDIQFDNLALMTFGTKATVTQTSATAATENIVGVHQGKSYKVGVTTNLPNGIRNIANVDVKVAAATKVLGTDYTVDLARGLVTIIAGGGIAEGATIILTYDKVASSYDQVISGHTPIEGALMFVADNPAGDNIDYEMPWARLTPNGEFGLKAENAIQQIQFNLKILKKSNEPAIYANGQPYVGS